ncbi:protein DMP4-like [Musa acuminata AAA Group]|uniref:protein DMP4-like n=1 Tax=Musa acuminata AAA Group TaxID=214697 RepID=UPI0031DEDF8B
MAPKMTDVEALQQQKQPLLAPDSAGDDQATLVQKAISQTFKSTAHLAKLLPTGTVLAFQLLSPIFTDGGHCMAVNRLMTECLVAICGLSCFVLSFTDSFRDGNGTVRYGLATFRGLWVIDGTKPLPPAIAARYRIKFIDLAHALVSVLVFAAVALFDQNVVSCFFPMPSEETKQVLTCLPVGIGVIGSILFVTFPTTRHGIGFPLSPH